MPAELDIAFLMEKGFYKPEDSGLLYRALEAIHLYRISQKVLNDFDNLTGAEAALAIKMEKDVLS